MKWIMYFIIALLILELAIADSSYNWVRDTKLKSNDLDGVCSTPDSFMFRFDTGWDCQDKNEMNITYLHVNYENTSVTASDYVNTSRANITAATIAYLRLDKTNMTGNLINLSTLLDPTYYSVQDWFSTTQSSGKISGGSFTSNGDGTVKVEGGTGVIRATASTIAETMFFNWSVNSSLDLTDDETNYIYVDYNGGTPYIRATVNKGDANNLDSILLGKIFREGIDLHEVEAGMNINDLARNILTRFTQMGGEVQRATGFVIAETGARFLTSTDGVLFAGLTRITTTGIDTTGAPTFEYYYYDGNLPGGADWVENDISQIDNANYNDVATGLDALTPNRYGVHWVYGGNDGHVMVLYGQDDYTLTNAELAQPPSSLPEHVADFSFLAAKLIVQEGEANLYSVESAYDTLFNPAGASVHNELGGLQGGSSDEYYHLNNTEYDEVIMNISNNYNGSLANFSYGGFSYFNVSNNASIKDLVVRSTLRVDKLYANETNISSGGVVTDPDGLYVNMTNATFNGSVNTSLLWIKEQILTPGSLSNPYTYDTFVNDTVISIALDSYHYGFDFSDDGVYFYITGTQFAPDRVYKYNLSTAWDMDTAVYDTYMTNHATATQTLDMDISNDGTKLHTVGYSVGRFYQYNLSVANDVTSAVYDTYITASTNGLHGIQFSADGTKLYLCLVSGAKIEQYNMTTAWDISTATLYMAKAAGFTPYSTDFEPDGLVMHVTNKVADTVEAFNLSIAWDINTISNSGITVPSGVANAGCAKFGNNGYNFYLFDETSNTLVQKDVGTGSPGSSPGHSIYVDTSAQIHLGDDGTNITLGTGQDGVNMSYDGTNFVIRTANESLTWFLSNVSAQDFIDRTPIWDVSTYGSALDNVKDYSSLISDVDGTLDHTKLSAPEQAIVRTDVIDCNIVEVEITKYCYTDLKNKSLVCGVEELKDIPIDEYYSYIVLKNTTLCTNRVETSRALSMVVSKHEQAIYELKLLVEELRNTLAEK